MPLPILKHKWLKVTLMALLIFVSIIVLAAFVLGRFGSSILQNKMNHALQKGTDSLYSVKFEAADINLLHGEIIIHNLQLRADTALFNKRRLANTTEAKLYTLHTKQLTLSHMHPFKYLFTRKVDIGLIRVIEPEVSISSYKTGNKQPKDNRTLYQKIASSLKSIHIGQIQFDNTKLRQKDFSKGEPAVTELRELDLKAQELLIDSATQFDTHRFFYCRDLSFILHNFEGQTAKGLYAYRIKRIDFSTQTQRLRLNDVTLHAVPRAGAYFQKTYQDLFDIKVNSVQFNNFDFEIFDRSHTIKVSSLVLDKGIISVFSNYRRDPKSLNVDKANTFPNKIIFAIPVKVKVDTVTVHQYTVVYKEYNVKAKRSGYITFNHINGNLLNVTNDSASLNKNHWATAKFNAKFMNRQDLHVAFLFNLRDSAYSYAYHGWAGPINMQAVNVATVPLASIHIKSGRSKKLVFDIQANRYLAKGKVALLYNDLNIELLKADSAELKMRKLALVSLLANALIIKNNNPDKPGEMPRSKYVIYRRPKTYPFFQTLWRTLFMGIESCVGLDAKAQKDADIKAAKKEKEKYLKEHKKEARKIKRAEKRRLKKMKKEQEKRQKEAAKQK